jgi:hypothetical protein
VAGTACGDDGDLCTSDVCDGAGQCTHPFEPAATCADAGSGRARLKIVNRNPRSLAKFQWRGGPAVVSKDFGDPTGGTSYELCIYDEQDGAPSDMYHGMPGTSGVCGPGACWATRPSGFRFRSGTGSPDGVTVVVLTAGAEGHANVQMRAKSTLALGPSPLHATPHAVAQIRTSAGPCWSASFSATGIKRNDATVFVGKSD